MRVTSILLAAFPMLAVLAVGPAAAESRLFSIRTDDPGVTVARAVGNGVELGVAGVASGVTFFRFDNPGGAVPCVGDMVFFLSDGSSRNRTIDFCALDWDVTLALSAPQAPQAPQAPRPAPGLPGAVAPSSVVVIADDPSVGIVNVYLGGAPANVIGSSSDGVEIALPPDEIGCERDLGLELDDGRTIARMVDVCTGDGVVIVSLTGQGPDGVVAPPPQTVQPLAPLPAAPQVAGSMVWFTDAQANTATLGFGVPATGAGELTAVCELESGETIIVLSRTTADLVPGGTVGVTFRAGGFEGTYPATGTAASSVSGRSHPRIDINTGDPLWPALIRENVLDISVGNLPPYGLTLKGSAVAARAFLARCNPAPPAPPPQPGVAPEVAFGCSDGTFLTAQFDNANGRVTVFDGGAGPIVLHRAGSQQGVRYVAAEGELVGLDERITWRRAGAQPTTCSPN